jgi:hypothetical protein
MGKGAAQCSAQNVRQMIDAKRVSNELVACAQGTSHKHIVQSVPTHVPQVPPDWRKTAIRPGIQHMRVEGCIYFVYGTGRKVCRRGKLAKERVPASESLWLVMSHFRIQSRQTQTLTAKLCEWEPEKQFL